MLQSSRLSLQTVLEHANSTISSGDPAEVGEGVLAVVSVLAENVALRKALADSSESAEKKQQLLLKRRISPNMRSNLKRSMFLQTLKRTTTPPCQTSMQIDQRSLRSFKLPRLATSTTSHKHHPHCR